MGPLANGAMCLSTPKHNGKSGTGTSTGELCILFVLHNRWTPLSVGNHIVYGRNNVQFWYHRKAGKYEWYIVFWRVLGLNPLHHQGYIIVVEYNHFTSITLMLKILLWFIYDTTCKHIIYDDEHLIGLVVNAWCILNVIILQKHNVIPCVRECFHGI